MQESYFWQPGPDVQEENQRAETNLQLCKLSVRCTGALPCFQFLRRVGPCISEFFLFAAAEAIDWSPPTCSCSLAPSALPPPISPCSFSSALVLQGCGCAVTCFVTVYSFRQLIPLIGPLFHTRGCFSASSALIYPLLLIPCALSCLLGRTGSKTPRSHILTGSWNGLPRYTTFRLF